MARSPEGAPKKHLGKEVLKATKITLGSLLALVAIGEATKVGTRKIDIQHEYAETLKKAEKEYKASGDTCGHDIHTESDGVCTDFYSYLDEQHIPRPEHIKTLTRLIDEFKYPVHIYSGTTLMQKVFAALGEMIPPRFSNNGMYGHWYPIEIFGHEVYINKSKKSDEEQVHFSTVDFAVIIAELAHAYQTEEGKVDPLLDISSKAHLLSPGGYKAAYMDPASGEYDAHTVLEPVLMDRYMNISDVHRASIKADVLGYIGLTPNTEISEKIITYKRYEAFVAKVERGVNKYKDDEPDYEAETMLTFLESLPGYTARFEAPKDKQKPAISLIPNKKQYEAFLTMLRPYEKPTDTITSLAPRPDTLPSLKVTKAFTEFRLNKEAFDAEVQDMKWFVAATVGGIKPDEEFTKELYEKMMNVLAENYDEIVVADMRSSGTLQSQKSLLHIVNNAWKFDITVRSESGVFQGNEEIGADRHGKGIIKTSEEHYRAMKRYFDAAKY